MTLKHHGTKLMWPATAAGWEYEVKWVFVSIHDNLYFFCKAKSGKKKTLSAKELAAGMAAYNKTQQTGADGVTSTEKKKRRKAKAVSMVSVPSARLTQHFGRPMS
jgi:hypothetical protein